MCVNKSTYAKNNTTVAIYLFIFFIFFILLLFLPEMEIQVRSRQVALVAAQKSPFHIFASLVNSTLLLSVKWFSLGHSLQKNTLAWKGKENKIATLYFKDSEEPFLNCYFFFSHWSWVGLNPETTFDLPAARRFFGGTCTEQGQNSPRLGAPHNPNFFSIMKRWSLCLSVSLSVSHTPVGMFH